ncbi:MAG: hypothetical protein WC515_00910 [Candidatus Omnitrophota bacterium]
MKYNIRKNWTETVELMAKNPRVLMPFIFIAFFEILALELIYFSPRWPISLVVDPIVKKFFGEGLTHYPAHLAILGKLFYYSQIFIYISVSVFLTAVTVQIFKNTKAGLPVITGAVIKNVAKRYFSFMAYGILFIALMMVIEKGSGFVFFKATRFISRLIPQIPIRVFGLASILGVFFLNVILQAFMISVVPLIVLANKPLVKAVVRSVTLAVKNFPTIIGLVLLPYLVYLPVVLLKSFSGAIMDKTVPESVVLVTVLGSVLSIFIDCFVILVAAQFVADKELGVGS